jgi:hypothetical protein
MSTNFTPRRRITNRRTLFTMALLALLAWCALLLFTRFVPPRSIASFTIFFALLFVALFCTLSPLAYVIGLRFITSRLYRATLRHSLRQGLLLSLWIMLNLMLLALRSWSLFTAIVSLGIVVVIEALSLARK